MNEELETRDTTEDAMIAKDEMATFEPFEMPTEGDATDLSDDDIAAALGFHTTLSEPLLPMDETDTAEDEAVETADESPETAMAADEETEGEQEEEPEKPPKEEGGEKKETEDRDDAQDEEIASILEELETLQKEVYGRKETKDTETA